MTDDLPDDAEALEPLGACDVEPALEPLGASDVETAPDAEGPPAATTTTEATDAGKAGDEPGVQPGALERRAVEAILMVADEPVTPQLLGELLEMAPIAVEELCTAMAQDYVEQGRGFVLARVAGGYRFQSHPDLASHVERFVLDGQAARLSAAALETLAIVAYKQPISRGQVAQIRGVNVDATMRTLVQRGYVAEVAVDPGPGQASLFGTTSSFLQNLGIDSLADLPPLGDLVPESDVMEILEASLRIDGETGRPVRGSASLTADRRAGDEPMAASDPDEPSSEPAQPASEPAGPSSGASPQEG